MPVHCAQKAILITVDFEDWFHVENLRHHFPHHTWEECPIRVETPTRRLLSLFEEYGVKATFFILGWLAQRIPNLVREIAERGHEIASHGLKHNLCYQLSESELFDDLQQSKDLLENIVKRQIHGYRAPSFSINKHLLKLLPIVGYSYDSSFNDFGAHSRYGSLPGKWTKVKPGLLRNDSDLYELPVRNLNLSGMTLPWAGGGYFRLLPFRLFKLGAKKILRESNSYLFYCHPWEFDPYQPKVKSLRIDYSFRHYININRNFQKLKTFLSTFSNIKFQTCSEFIASNSQ